LSEACGAEVLERVTWLPHEDVGGSWAEEVVGIGGPCLMLAPGGGWGGEVLGAGEVWSVAQELKAMGFGCGGECFSSADDALASGRWWLRAGARRGWWCAM
jgi:hypothetical protein